jgi:hypothetical protein
MKRIAGALVLLAALGGCMSMDRDTRMTGGQYWGEGPYGHFGVVPPPPSVPGVQASGGQPLAMAQPYALSPPRSDAQAYQMMSRSVPLDLVQTSNQIPGSAGTDTGVAQANWRFPLGCGPGGCMPSGPVPPGGLMAPPGAPFCPGQTGPGPMTLSTGTPMLPPGCFTPPQNAVAAVGALPGCGQPQFPIKRTQVRFTRPSGMKVAWLTSSPDGRPTYSPTVLEVPGRYNFLQAAIYRLKLTNIDRRPGLEVYPTLEVVPANPKTDAFLAHSAVPVEFTDADFDQIAAGNYVVKVIYLPDPQFQEITATGIEEISTLTLPPGTDPIVEALRRGSILLIIRMGNMDQEAPNTPPIDAPGGHAMMSPGGPATAGMLPGGSAPLFSGLTSIPGAVPASNSKKAETSPMSARTPPVVPSTSLNLTPPPAPTAVPTPAALATQPGGANR